MINGGVGSDAITLTRGQTFGPATLDGLLDITVLGGLGNDVMTVDFGGGAFGTVHPDGRYRGLRLRLYGQAGGDQFTVNLSNDSTATFNYDVLLHGGSGGDSLSFQGVNAGGATFGAAVVLDGGFGVNSCVVGQLNNFPVQRLHC